ncbi:DUF6290 family protein [Phenylobacterium sp.]|uniref:DUF6290 family protein n=1 Tax=Phenylobacterium sp. TaxID=1871053 RepID=UPI0025DEBA59|nr:DUF6290 family protein [Phenylobacterium sp.]
MADGEIRVKVDDETEQRLKALAEAAGLSVSDYVRDIISDSLQDDDLAEDLAALEEYDRTGVSYSVEEAMAHFRSELDGQVKKDR